MASGVGGGIRIAYGVAFFVPPGLSKDASQFDFARLGRLAVGLAFAPLSLFLHHRHSCAVHLHIQKRNRLTHDDRKIQLDGFVDFALFALGDVGAPMASAVRSTDLAVTSTLARSFICSRP